MPDLEQKSDGRGAYICKKAECLTKARKKKALERSYKKSIASEIYDVINRMGDSGQTP